MTIVPAVYVSSDGVRVTVPVPVPIIVRVNLNFGVVGSGVGVGSGLGVGSGVEVCFGLLLESKPEYNVTVKLEKISMDNRKKMSRRESLSLFPPSMPAILYENCLL